MGTMEIPAGAYYGAQTARAVRNFPVSGLRFPRPFLRAVGLIKKHAAQVNGALQEIPLPTAGAIGQAAQEVADGAWDEHFVLDIFQTGSGTSTNMNANEVIANRAIELLGGRRGDKSVHPNDHVNRGQSSNDVIPSAIHVAATEGIDRRLLPALGMLAGELELKAGELEPVAKIGRTHLQDAVPMRLGQEFGGYAAQVRSGIEAIESAKRTLEKLALGGTAIGTGINAHPEFAGRVIDGLARETGLDLKRTGNHFAAQGGIEGMVCSSGALRLAAVSLIKIANDIRWLGSGPRCGLGEIRLPAVQPGSSIMPGKVNPVLCEMLIQVGAQVLGNDATIGFAGTFGNFELNTLLPVCGYNLIQSIELLANASRLFAEKCVKGIEADRAQCESYVERSLALATAFVPKLGYDRAAELARHAQASGRTVREVAIQESGLDSNTIERLLGLRS